MRVFVNDVDSYVGRAIAEVRRRPPYERSRWAGWADAALWQTFSKVFVGWSTVDEQEDDGDDGEAPAPKPQYELVGTLQGDGPSPVPLAEVVPRTRHALAAAIKSCDHIIFHQCDTEAQADDAAWAAQSKLHHGEAIPSFRPSPCLCVGLRCLPALFDAAPSFAQPKTFVCVSPCLTWAKTKSADPVWRAPSPAPSFNNSHRRTTPRRR